MGINEFYSHLGQTLLIGSINVSRISLKPHRPVVHVIDRDEKNIRFFCGQVLSLRHPKILKLTGMDLRDLREMSEE